MSGFEREELQAVIKGMTQEQQELAATVLPDEIIWNEMFKRFMDAREQVKDIRRRLQP